MLTSVGRHILLVLLIFCSTAHAQEGVLKGSVTEKATGEGVPAIIVIQGTYHKVVADIDGSFKITGIKTGDYTIKVTMVGYADVLYTGYSVKAGVNELDVQMVDRQTMKEVVVIGEKPVVDIESGSSETYVSRKDIKEMGVTNVQEVAAMQAGVSVNPDGIQIRGGRTYETEYTVDGISAQDPLAGTGFGVDVSSNAIQDVRLITGGADAEFGDGSSGVVATTIREGGENFMIAGSWQRDNLGFKPNNITSWNTDIFDLAVGGAVPGTKKKLRYFASISAFASDDYFGVYADQLHSSFFNNDSVWAPRQNNKFTNTIKLTYWVDKKTKISVTNQHSLAINQSTRTLQIVGFDAVVTPGFQYYFSLDPDNANTYTHNSNLTVLSFQRFLNKQWTFNANVGRLFTNLRADANGQPFRDETVDQIYDAQSIVTNPVDVYNPEDSIVFVFPGPGLANNGGIASLWHDHYAQELTFKGTFSYRTEKNRHRMKFGWEHKELEYQWVDVTRPWVGAPIVVNDTLTTPSISVGSSSDVWHVKPAKGGFFFSDRINFNGIIANLGLRMNYWAPGKFADEAVENPDAPVVDAVRDDYIRKTLKIGRRYKARILPRINVTFPVTENNMLYFNYGHSMRLPHPRFVYAGLDPVYQDRGFLSRLGNPDLDPEVTVSYELGLKTQFRKNLAFTVTAFNNDKYDYIVTRTILVKDQTGRTVEKTFNINQDYAKIQGVEIGVYAKVMKYVRINFNAGYQVAKGKSNTAAESLLQIRTNGFANTTKEQFLAWDRPFDFKLGIIFVPDSTLEKNKWLNGFRVFLYSTLKSGLRYTPYQYVGESDLGRPLYEPIWDQPNSKISAPWFWTDLRITRDIFIKRKGRLSFTLDIKNLFNNKIAQIINPVTGKAYEYGDPVPESWRDPAYPDPQDYGRPPFNPARYRSPMHIMFGISFSF